MTFVVTRTGHGTVFCTRGDDQTTHDETGTIVSMDFWVIRFLTLRTLIFRFVIGLTFAGDCLDRCLVVDDAGAMAVATHLIVHIIGGGGPVRVAIQLTPTAPPIVLTSFTMLPAIVTMGIVVVQTVADVIRAVVVGIARSVPVASVFVDATAIKSGPGAFTDALGQWTVLVRNDGVELASAMAAARRRQFHATRTHSRTVVANVVRIADTFQPSFVADLTTSVARTWKVVGGTTGLFAIRTKIVIVTHTL